MKNELTQLVSKPFTRRKFLEGVGAVGATAALASCGDSGKGPQSLFKDNPANVPVPPINGVVVAGLAPHNCGGRCVTKAYVENGVIKRFVTDERPDKNIIDGSGADPQRRACVRCRAQKGFMYRSDRVLKPLKQMGERGDVNGFVEISWDQAFTEIAQKLVTIKATYGAAALYNHYASGDGAMLPSAASLSGRLLSLMGGYQVYRNDYSHPAVQHMSQIALGTDMSSPFLNDRYDIFNSEQIIFWAFNGAETIWGNATFWLVQQAVEKGAKLVTIDSRISQSSATAAAQHIAPVTGTDPALMLAMMYHLLAEQTLDGRPARTLLDPAFIKTHVHGFFDDPTPTLYHSDVQSVGNYVVPPGASLSAYIMGNDNSLVTAGLNQATSIYPATIGYNVNADDALHGKTVPIYGQVPKTPEWAEAITGVPAATIRALAESIVQKKTTIWMGGGWQRNMESEQPVWLLYILGAVTKSWGTPGRTFGFYVDRVSAGNLGMNAVANPVVAAGGALATCLYDSTKVTSLAYTKSDGRTTWPVYVWPDVAKNGGTGKSDWNDGQVKRMPVGIKALLNFGGNALVNQTGGAEYVKGILRDRSKIELIVVSDHYMTSSAAFADYLLPAATAFEKFGSASTWRAGENLLFMGKAVEPLGDARSDYDITTGIAEKLGVKDAFTQGRTDEGWIKYAWDNLKLASPTYDEWKATGVYSTASASAPPVVKWGKPNEFFQATPSATNCLKTPSGKFEAFSQSMVEDYCARGYDNIDPSTDLVNGGALFDPSQYGTSKLATSTKGRFVYPIPMYIPLAEGRHANEALAPHPDPFGLRQRGYGLMLQTWHMQYRSHSTHNNNAFLNECYKRDARGQAAFLSPKRALGAVWETGVYEPIWINPATAQQFGISDGDRVLVSNERGRIYGSARVTQRAQPSILFMGQGSWHQLDGNGVDVGGCPNTLMSPRPSRICQGDTVVSGILVKIEKA